MDRTIAPDLQVSEIRHKILRNREFPNSPRSPLSPTPSSGASSPIKFVHVDSATFLTLSQEDFLDDRPENFASCPPSNTATCLSRCSSRPKVATRMYQNRNLSGPLVPSSQESMADLQSSWPKTGPIPHNTHRNGTRQYFSGPLTRGCLNGETKKNGDTRDRENSGSDSGFDKQDWKSISFRDSRPPKLSPGDRNLNASEFNLETSKIPISASSPRSVTPLSSASSRRVLDWDQNLVSPERSERFERFDLDRASFSCPGLAEPGPRVYSVPGVSSHERWTTASISPSSLSRVVAKSQSRKVSSTTAHRLPPLPLADFVVSVPPVTEGKREEVDIISRGLAAVVIRR